MIRLWKLLLLGIAAAVVCSPAIGACTSPIAPGDWNGVMVNTLGITRDDTPPLIIKGSSVVAAKMQLKIACDGGVTGTFSDVKAQAEFVMSMGDAPDHTVCGIAGGYTLLSGHVLTGKNGKPLLQINVQTHLGGTECNGGMLEDMVKGILESKGSPVSANYEFNLQSTAINPNGISGNQSWLDAQGASAVASMAESGEGIEETYCWALSSNGNAPPACGLSGNTPPPNNPPAPPKEQHSPVITDFRPALVSDFLAHVPAVANTYTAAIDWQGSTPKSVVFDIADPNGTIVDSKSAAENGNASVATFDIGDKATGLYHVRVTATNDDGLKAQKEVPLNIVPTPSWAVAAGIHSAKVEDDCTADQPAFGCQIYGGITDIAWPLQGNLPQVDIPSFVPFVGGKWGLQPITFHVPIQVTSRGGGFATDDVTGHGFIALGDTSLSIDVRQPTTGSRTRTNTSDTGVEFVAGQADGANVQASAAVLELPKIEPITKSIDLLSLIPGAHLIYKIPVFGQVIEVAVPKLVQAQIDLALTGDAEFAVNDSGKIDLSAGHVTTDLTGTVGFGPNITIANAQIVGQLNGKLTMALAPVPAVSDCELNYSFFLIVGAFGFQQTVPENPTLTKLVGCTKQVAFALAPAHPLGFPMLAASMLSLSSSAIDLTPPAVATTSNTGNATLLHPHLAGRVGWQPETGVSIAPLARPPQARHELMLVHHASALVAAPAVAASTAGDVALVWIAEDPGLQRPQAWQVKLRIHTGKGWSRPIAIGDGMQENQMPSVAFDAKGQVIVAWMQNRPPTQGYGDVLTEHSYDGAEIAVAVVDGSSGTVRRQILTGDNVADADPRMVTTHDGTVWLAWRVVASQGRALFKIARWNGAMWSPIETVDARTSQLRAWRFCAGDVDNAAVLATSGDGLTDRLTFWSRSKGAWSTGTELANALPANAGITATFGVGGKPVFAWSNGTAIVGDEAGGRPQLWLQTMQQPVALAAGSWGISLIVAGPAGLSAQLRLPSRGWIKPVLLVPPFASLTSLGVARTSAGNWLIVRAQTSPGALDRAGGLGNPIPQNSDIVLNGPE